MPRDASTLPRRRSRPPLSFRATARLEPGMRLAHTPGSVAALRAASPDDPLRVMLSGCLAGLGCGVDGSDNGVGVVAIVSRYVLDLNYE